MKKEERLLKKFLNTGRRASEDEIKQHVTAAFASMGHEIREMTVLYLGHFPTERSDGVARHHYQMMIRLIVNDVNTSS